MTQHLCDSNIWVALNIETHTQHALVRDWLSTIIEPASLLFCRATQLSLLRLATSSALLAPYGAATLTNDEAWALFDACISDDRVGLVSNEPTGLAEYWRQYSRRGSVSPNLWMDAYLAAFARAGGYRFVTLDRAFRQFDNLDLLVLGEGR